MNLLRLPVLSLATALLLMGTSAGAKSVRQGAVEAELVAAVAAVQPGHPFDVALRLAHDEHWHTYWTNPGTGLATSLKWTLPPGWRAGDIQWPVPHVLQDEHGAIIGNGYDGEVFLMITLTPPADLPAGTKVTLQAKADWLMCRESCVPGTAALELTLPVAAAAPAPDAVWGTKLAAVRRQLPQPPDGWSLTATRAAKTVTLTARPPDGTDFAAADLRFFSDNGLIAYDQPQPVSVRGRDLVFQLPVDAAVPADAKGLTGVLALSKGGGAGIRVDLPWGAAGATQNPKLTTQNLAPVHGFAGTLVLAFLGGLILNLMPCVFPVLGIKILGFVNQAGADHRKVTLHGLVFALGVVVSFWVLAGMMLALRAGGSQVGWGFQLQEPAVVFVLAAVLLGFALNLSGLFEVGLSAVGAGAQLQARSGYAGSFFTGVLATVVATPCSAPFLVTALSASLTLPAAASLVMFTLIGLGLATPYLVLSFFPGCVRLLPRPGVWMETFKQLMAFPLYLTVGWLVWVLAGQTRDNDYALLYVLAGLTLVALAAWFYGRYAQAHGRPLRQMIGRGLALGALGAGLLVGWPEKPRPLQSPSGYNLAWQKWSPETVTKLRAEGKTLYVDFTARWCFTCQTNKAAVFSSKAVLNALAARGVVLLKADWTNRDPEITAAMASFHRNAVPLDLIYAPGRDEPVILPELLTPDMVLRGLDEAAPKP
jgi:thiol:disulfide interchange protein/DsbC/DsbD-like thiol-disulfide interchange protein